MLLGDFYTFSTIEKNEGEFQAQIFLNKNHDIYNGHFPKVPIVPGVCQVQILKETIQEVLGLELQLVNAKEIKFLSMINPFECDSFQLNVKFEQTELNTLKVTSISSGSQRIFLKFKGAYSIK